MIKMSWFSIKNDKVRFVLIVSFLIWIIFLISMIIFASRDVIFYDGFNPGTPLSDYSSIIPPLRYVFEPIIGLAMTTAKSFPWVISAIFIYGILRIIYHIGLKNRFRRSEKYRILVQIAHDFINFTLIVFLFLIISIVIFLGIGFALSGFLFLNNYWNITLQFTVYILLGALVIRLGYVIIRYFHPKKQLKQVKSSKIKSSSKFRKVIKQFLKELRIIGGLFLICASILILLVTINFPTHQIETELAENEYLFDFHVHTYMSDGFLSPEDRVQWYIQAGINGAAFTDHENQRGYERAKTYVELNSLDFHVIQGQEYTTDTIHLNYFGVSDVIVPLEKASTGVIAMNVSDMIGYVKSQGGFVIVNHYESNSTAPYSYNDLFMWGVDGFEIINNAVVQSSEIRTFCLSNNLACIGGSDTHTNQELNTFVKITLNDPDNLTHIFETLKNNTHEVVYIPFYGTDDNLQTPLGLIDGFIIWFGYFMTLDLFQILSWITWSVGAFILLLFVYNKLKKMDLHKLKRISQ